ncbi:GNAT family N-acetyltransferase [Tetragenococcus koreensis]|uniref:GNAT family N-acetyltransferase n=1 Tax=Tetragenococcus koreensis TaxID=290335 RepID=UPI001F2F29AF|nr:GNAT family N-acetyltransferase [Tetragenococcus koreensis]MCF1584341.1 GNAT family N-acetyltransferase [Tetragenococcus koreensis]MCF1613890.1 GNAT family N-acetyltransferase [Tetragenococcus koreensis]MCF1623668.1 GNAT family N-acetyltransferase [Tetragenococcus koreensis]MCF1628592.1 GNAT family N-acetyltransferase [Tetragenococcus koreensis]MCF1631731.1 GNAT family N-acetyltransferase [Tetragenococcus koreensis]
MENETKLCPLDENVIEECVDLFIATFSKEPWNDVYESRKQVFTFFENHINNNYFVGYVLKENNTVIALSIGTKKPWIKGMEYYIDQFCVKTNFQGRGVGSEFLFLIETDIKKKGRNAIILNTDKGFPSESFYLKNGFQLLEETVFLAK